MSGQTGFSDAERAELLELVLQTFEKKKIILSSGKESDFYFDLRQTLMSPRGVDLAGRAALAKLREGTPVDSVGGMAVGAVPFVTAILAAASGDAQGRELKGFFVRKEPKKHGKGKQIEGGFAAGQTVALVEDTTTTGGSTLDAVDLVEAAGGKVARVLCLVDRGEGAIEKFAERGIVLEPIYGRGDLPL